MIMFGVALMLWGCTKQVGENFYVIVLPMSTTTTVVVDIDWGFVEEWEPCVTAGCYCNGIYVCQ